MADGILGLLLPTFRFDVASRHAIATAASLGSDDIHVYIGDNSCDPRKWAYLEEVARRSVNCHVFCHETNLGGGHNTAFLFEQQAHEYTATISDDDVYSPDYFLAGLEELRRNPSCAVASGQLFYVTPNGRSLDVAVPGSIVAPTAYQRITGYNDAHNSITYGVYRRALVRGFVDYLRLKPVHPSYMDQFLSYTLLSQGTYVVHPDRRAFVYNNDNWSADNHARNGAKYYVNAGLPADFQALNTLMWAVDCLHFFHSTFCPAGLLRAEAEAIGVFLYRRFHRHFVSLAAADVARYVGLFQHSAPALLAFRALLEGSPHDVAEVIAHLGAIMQAFDGAIAERTVTFLRGSLLPAAARSAAGGPAAGTFAPPPRPGPGLAAMPFAEGAAR